MGVSVHSPKYLKKGLSATNLTAIMPDRLGEILWEMVLPQFRKMATWYQIHSFPYNGGYYLMWRCAISWQTITLPLSLMKRLQLVKIRAHRKAFNLITKTTRLSGVNAVLLEKIPSPNSPQILKLYFTSLRKNKKSDFTDFLFGINYYKIV